MKVVQLIDSLKRGGGAESLVYNFAKEAKSAGISCYVVSIRTNDPVMCKELGDEGVPTNDFPARRLIHPMRFLRLVKHLKAINPDVIHTHLTGSTILGITAARVLKKPVVVTLHNVKIASKDHLYHGRLEAWLLRNWAKYIIAVGDRTAKAHIDTVGKTPMSVIPNAVRKPHVLDNQQKLKIREEIFPNYEGLVIATVGSLTEQKGYANLLNTLAKIDVPFRCMIIGQGPLLGELEELAKSLGVEAKVKFLGLRSDINDLLSASDIYVSSSLWEGLPVATLEAMYARLPIISTAVGDAELILQDNTGILVDAGDNDMMAKELERLLKNNELRNQLAQKSFARVDSEYNSDAWMSNLKGVYSDLCK